MTESADRRRQRRVRLPGSHGRLVVSLDGTVLDISLSGMAVETQTRISPHRVLTLRLGDRERPLQLAGKVVWCFLHGTRSTPSGEQVPLYRAGIQFLDVLSPQARELLDFLEQHAIVTLDTRIFGRFVVSATDPVEVSSSADFRVLELDASGLTVETASGLDPQTGCEVELRLDHTQLVVRTIVEQATPPAAGTDRWTVRLRFAGLDPEARETILAFLAGELGEGEGDPAGDAE